MPLESLVELKLAAGRPRDDADVIELARENADQIARLRDHLAATHPQYASRFEELLVQIDDTGA